MGNCNKKVLFNPGGVLDRVIAGGGAEDECLLYKLANYKKGGQLVEAFTGLPGKPVVGSASKAVEEAVKTLGYLMYNDGRGEMITTTEYLRWKYRNNEKDKISIDESKKTIYDPLHTWEDHEACWRMQYRGSLGESLLHVLIICDSPIHTRIARLLLKHFPRSALDMVEGEEYLGATGLHLAIAYGNDEVAEQLIACGASPYQRARGVFFMPTDQQSNKPVVNTDYKGLCYLGEYPLAWSACLCNEGIYNLLLVKGADPDAKDSYGNTVLHMVVVATQLGMYGYSLRHPLKSGNALIKNNRGLTSLTLACELGRDDMFTDMLELSCTEFWRYSNITCCGYPLGALDSIQPDGQTNWASALIIVLAGTKPQHLNMLEGGIIAKLLEEKWKTFARGIFFKKMAITLIHLLCMSCSIYSRPPFNEGLMNGLKPDTEMGDSDMMRYCFEVATLLSVFSFMIIQQGGEIKNAGVSSFWKNLKGSPPKLLFVVANLLLLSVIPLRVLMTRTVEPEDGEECEGVTCQQTLRIWEESLLVFAVPGSWFYLLFFAGAIKLTGPFVTMIFSMITGDMFTFSIIYVIFLFGFSQAFYFIMKTNDESELFQEYHTTWVALFHMTLGEYEYDEFDNSPYPSMAKAVFVLFQILIPILLLNMLIAMMGNTYAIVIEKSEKEFLKQWAKVIMSIERSLPPQTNKDSLEAYSIQLGPTDRGVMVIKSKDKTRACQRKGSLANWKTVGKTIIKHLQKRGISGDDLRREMWVHDEASTPKANRKKKGKGYDISFALQPPQMAPGMMPGMMTGMQQPGMMPGMQQPGMMGMPMQPGMQGMMPGMQQPGMMGMPMQPGMQQPGMMGMPMQPGMPGMQPMDPMQMQMQMGMQPGMQQGMPGMQPGMPMDPMMMQQMQMQHMQMQQMQPGMQGLQPGMQGAGLPPIEQQGYGGLGPGVQDLAAMRTPHGGIRINKKTKQQKKQDMHDKKRSRKALNKQLMSMDFGLMAPPESESSDDEMFTGILLEPVPDHTSDQQPVLQGRRRPPLHQTSSVREAKLTYQESTERREAPSYQVSTEREVLTSSEEEPSPSPSSLALARAGSSVAATQGEDPSGRTNQGFVTAPDDPAAVTGDPEADKPPPYKESDAP